MPAACVREASRAHDRHQTEGSAAARDDGPLVSAVKRHVKSQLGLDLSMCQHWLRYCEVHFSRAGPLDEPEIPEVSSCPTMARLHFHLRLA